MRISHKILFWGLLPTLLLLSQCSSSSEIDSTPENPEAQTVTLTIKSPSTRTSLENDSRVLWSVGDQVQINYKKYEVVPDANDPSTATIADVAAAREYYAAYSKDYKFVNEWRINTFLPAIQTYSPNSFGQYANPMVAYSTTTSLTFKNIAGVIRLGVTGENTSIRSLSIGGNNNETLSDELYVSGPELKEGIIKTAFTEDGTPRKTVTLDCGEGVALSATPTYFYVVLPTGTLEKGFTVTMVDSEGRVSTQSTQKSVTVDRAGIKDMAAFAFTPAPAIEIELADRAPSTISYRLTAAPKTLLRTLVVSLDAWNKYIQSGEIAEKDLPRKLLNEFGTLVTVDAEGFYTAKETRALSYNNLDPILPGKDYRVLTSYSDLENSVGEIKMSDTSTTSTEGLGPKVYLTEGPLTERPYNLVQFNIRAENAVNILCYNLNRTAYDKLAETMTDTEILRKQGSMLSIEEVAQANAAAGHIHCFQGHHSKTDYLLLVSAIGENGKETIEKKNYTTVSYPYPAGTWKVLDTSAKVWNSTLFDKFEIPFFDINNITVEKMLGKDIFRITNPFSTANIPVLAEKGFTDMSGGPYYLYIDARNRDKVVVEPGENCMGILHPDKTTVLHLASTRLLEQSGEYGTYEPEYNISLGTLAIYNGDHIYSSGSIYLTIPAGISDNGSMSTEDFNKDETTTDW